MELGPGCVSLCTPSVPSLIYMLVAARVASRCFAHVCHNSLLRTSSLTPFLASSQPTRAVLALWGDLSATVMAGYPLLCKQRRLVLWGGVFSPEGLFICTVIL